MEHFPSTVDWRAWALQAWQEADPSRKVALVKAPARPSPKAAMQAEMRSEIPSTKEQLEPGHPALPRLVSAFDVPRRAPSTLEGRAAMLHAITHIEFNAINLALDAVWRFDSMPSQFYSDWALVAREEALHFSLLRAHLQNLAQTEGGTARWDYGSFLAHNGLWEMCAKTTQDIVARMALVPRTLEARGLDATPQIQAKLRQVKTEDAQRTVEILQIILRDEIGHVAVGNHWYRLLCAERGIEPLAHFRALLHSYRAPKLLQPLNLEARKQAGFTQQEIDALLQSQAGVNA